MHDDSTVKLCECGCGEPAPISQKKCNKYGYVKGQPMRFVRGHAMRGKRLSAEAREKIGARQRGEKRDPAWGRKISESLRGSKNVAWKGGRIIREGRVLALVGKDHPMADGKGYAYEHRLVMSALAGRTLLAKEHVHHIDLDPLNNDESNLVILTRGQHTSVHNLIRMGHDPASALAMVIE